MNNGWFQVTLKGAFAIARYHGFSLPTERSPERLLCTGAKLSYNANLDRYIVHGYGDYSDTIPFRRFASNAQPYDNK